MSAQVAPIEPRQAANDGRPITIGVSYELHSRILGATRRINVRLPDHYGETRRTFPVLFLLDGGEAEDFLHIAGLTQIIAAYGAAQEMIVVGIASSDRRHDLTAPSKVARDRTVAPTSGGSTTYRRFLVDELKPWIARKFATQGRTVVMGESLAGLFVLETILEEPRAFDDYIAVSPSLWWNAGELTKIAPASLRSAGFAGHRVWIAFDQPAPPADQIARDMALQNDLERAFSSAQPSGLKWTVVRPDEGHGSIYHPAAFEALRTLFATELPKH